MDHQRILNALAEQKLCHICPCLRIINAHKGRTVSMRTGPIDKYDALARLNHLFQGRAVDSSEQNKALHGLRPHL